MVARVYPHSHPSHLHTSIHINEKRCEGGCEGGVKLTERVGMIEPGQSFVTPDALARRAVGEAHGRAMALQAAAIAAEAGAYMAGAPRFRLAIPAEYDPEAALHAAEGAQRRAERRLRSDKLALLAEQGRLGQCEWRAAQEMRHVAEYAEGGRVPLMRSQLRERLPSGGDGTGELMAAEELVSVAYLPWRRYARRYPVAGDATLEDLTRRMVLDGRGLRQVANAIRIDQRRALRLLRRSLGHYAGLRGWASEAAELC